MKLADAAAVFAAYGAWRATGSARAGAQLARALASDDETSRTVAGTLLARATDRALPLLRANLSQGIAVAMTLRVLADAGGREVVDEIEPYTHNSDPQIARAARDALAAARATGLGRP